MTTNQLTEERRQQLDQIVRDMVRNGESDNSIKFVVDDFKKKYNHESEPEPEPVPESRPEKKKSFLDQFGVGFIKGAGETLQNIGHATMALPSALPGGKTYSERLEEVRGTTGFRPETFEAQGGAQKAGKFTERVAELALPQTKISKVGKGASLLKKGTEIGTRALTTGAVISAQEGEVGKGAALGAGLEVALPGVGSVLKKGLSGLPNRFINSALKRSKAQVIKDISKDKFDDLADYVLKNKSVGTADKLFRDSDKAVSQLSTKITNILQSTTRKSGGKVTIGTTNIIDDVVKSDVGTNALLDRKDVISLVERIAPQTKKLLQKSSLELDEANKLRQIIDKALGDRAFMNQQLSTDKEILKEFANTLRNTVKTKAPREVAPMFEELSLEIQLRNQMLDRIAAGEGKQILSMGDFIGGGLGGFFGGGVGGAVAGVTMRRVLESVPFKLGSAKFVNALLKAEGAINKLPNAEREAIIALIVNAANPDEDNQTIAR